MPSQSSYTLAKRLAADITRILAAAQVAGLIEPSNQREVAALKHDIVDVRLDVRDYELAETKAEQQKLGRDATSRLQAVQQGILATSQYNIFSAIEVAQLSATIAQLQERLV